MKTRSYRNLADALQLCGTRSAAAIGHLDRALRLLANDNSDPVEITAHVARARAALAGDQLHERDRT